MTEYEIITLLQEIAAHLKVISYCFIIALTFVSGVIVADILTRLFRKL